MNALAYSYEYCRRIAKDSHSNFYVAFHLLSGKRRMAMDALYAFARIADDSSDGEITVQEPTAGAWETAGWHRWVDSLVTEEASQSIKPLDPIRLALKDSVQQFAIPLSVLHDMIDGIEFDLDPASQIQTWGDLSLYCHRVASSVGLGCLAIWLPPSFCEIPVEAKRYAEACGVAFQLTNILRDVVEDAGRGRCYIPSEDLARFGLTREEWTASLLSRSAEKTKSHIDIMQVVLERAKGHFELGAKLSPYLCLEGKRMFSLMWKTYYGILSTIEANPKKVFRERVALSKVSKLKLIASHFLTPLYRAVEAREGSSQSGGMSNSGKNNPRPNGSECGPCAPKVAIIGGGLAGCNAAMHLARHGVEVELFEARSRLGGRVGSFYDRHANTWVDYCQHVGMNCCTELKRWIADTGQSGLWESQNTLHFVDPRGKKIAIKSLPLPAPFHLASLIFKWPGLSLGDRIRVAICLNSLTKIKRDPSHDSQLAIDWLRMHWQTEPCLERFWETILVSALGEKLSKVTLGAMRKVLVDGFARSRDAYHLLVPSKPLSELSNGVVRDAMEKLKVRIHDQSLVARLERMDDRRWVLYSNEKRFAGYDAVLIAVPWHQVNKILPEVCQSEWSPQSMQSSPITGIHTWWDRPWLDEPHAIFVQGLCQWVFPGNRDQLIEGDAHAYYQIVVSASHELRSEDPDKTLERVVEELRVAYPASSHATLVRGRIVTDPQAVFSISPDAEPRRWRADQFGEYNLFVAGDWTKTEWPATMEGALRSGSKAAECVMASLGIPVELLT
ncbi:MAG: hydroxysqualene dehydroxylase HpnE [Pirellula sp.]|jgi:squalene-associated FAD-dependent desaturase